MNKIRSEIKNNLSSLGKKLYGSHISELRKDSDLNDYSVTTSLANFDYSKNRINQESLNYLLEALDSLEVRKSLKELFEGETENPTENQYVSHTIYRNKNFNENYKSILSERDKMKSFLESSLEKRPFKNLICISIGGSRLGPELLYEFQSLSDPVKVFFCSSYDLLELKDTLKSLKQKDTVIFISSKSFQTSEILKNLSYVKSWLKRDPTSNIDDHLYAISSNTAAMASHDIPKDNQFVILDSLGGRYSVWSSISIPGFINSDFECYLDFLEGASLADKYTLNEPWRNNISAIMALLSVWNSNALKINNHAVFTYNFRLRSLTKYIAQLSMESNGKSINHKFYESPFNTSPLIWGGYGIELQHSVFQWLLQGKTESSCDFIGVNNDSDESFDSHKMLLSQVIALTEGKKDKVDPYKSIEGNTPCSVLQINTLNLRSLGFIMALYEHKTFIEAIILGLDPFDQWGVQLGKNLVFTSKTNNKFFEEHFPQVFLPKC
mgnify:CR=1 FL=1